MFFFNSPGGSAAHIRRGVFSAPWPDTFSRHLVTRRFSMLLRAGVKEQPGQPTVGDFGIELMTPSKCARPWTARITFGDRPRLRSNLQVRADLHTLSLACVN